MIMQIYHFKHFKQFKHYKQAIKSKNSSVFRAIPELL